MKNLFSKSAVLILLLSMSIGINAQSKRNIKQEETNKKIVTVFYQALFGDKDPSAIDKYIVEDYISIIQRWQMAEKL